MSKQMDHPGMSTGTQLPTDLYLNLLDVSVTLKETVKLLHAAVGNLDHCATLVAMCQNHSGMRHLASSPTAKGAQTFRMSGQAGMTDIPKKKPTSDLNEQESLDQQPATSSPLSTRLAALNALIGGKSLAQFNLEERFRSLRVTQPNVPTIDLLRQMQQQLNQYLTEVDMHLRLQLIFDKR